MIIKKDDRRVKRTQTMLFDAFIFLLIEKGYEAITIQDIIDRANVGRSTFYSHYLDKEQLLHGCINRLRELLKNGNEGKIEGQSGSYKFSFSRDFFEHVRSHKQLYVATVGKNGSPLVLRHMRRMLSKLMKEEILALLPSVGAIATPPDLAVEFVINTMVTLLTWWTEQDMTISVEEIDTMFHKLVFSGILPSV